MLIFFETVCSSATTSETDSFFMSKDESKMVQNFLNGNPNSQIDNTKEKNFKVSGILYLGEGTWTVWINGVSYSSIGQHEKFSIDSVCENEITLTLRDGTTLVLCISSDEEEYSAAADDKTSQLEDAVHSVSTN